jgi:thioredoxin 1
MVLTVTEQTFLKEVLESRELVLVNFGAPWCGLCRIIQPIVQSYHAQWNGEIRLVAVNADENFKLANTYRLKSLPTLLLFARGEVIERLEGFYNRDDFCKSLEAMFDRRSSSLLRSSER